MGTLKVSAPSDREIAMTRVFDAPRNLVFDAFTQPALIKRWLLGPAGWSMPICEVDLRVGGTYRYVWRRDADGSEMGMGGVYREIVRHERIVATERFDEAWYPGEGVGTLILIEQGGKTTVTQTMLYESRAARDAVLKSGMERGVKASYDRLAELLASTREGFRMTWRGAGAVLAGLVAVFVLSLGTDQVLHMLQVYPPWGQRMADPLFLLATAYRTVFNVLGGYIAARLAPHAPMRHALALGIVGFVLSAAGAAVTIAKPELGPAWYPIVLVVEAIPCAWLGGVLYRPRVT